MKRLLFCSGKIFYDLIAEREKRKIEEIAIVRIEQLYPLDVEKLKGFLSKYIGIQECFWVQEEQQNAGAWNYIAPILQQVLPKEVICRYAGRAPSATTATGSHKKHKLEQQMLLDQGLT